MPAERNLERVAQRRALRFSSTCGASPSGEQGRDGPVIPRGVVVPTCRGQAGSDCRVGCSPAQPSRASLQQTPPLTRAFGILAPNRYTFDIVFAGLIVSGNGAWKCALT